MPHRKCGKRRLSDAEYHELVSTGRTVPLAFVHADRSVHFKSLRPTSVGRAQEPYSYRTQVDVWPQQVHAAGLCPAACGRYPEVVHISWSNETERRSREYANEIASSGL